MLVSTVAEGRFHERAVDHLVLRAAAAAAALVFIPISLFAVDLQNCDPSLQAPLCSGGVTRAAEELPVLAAAVQKPSQEAGGPADVSGAGVLAEGRVIVGKCCFSDKPSSNYSPSLLLSALIRSFGPSLGLISCGEEMKESGSSPMIKTSVSAIFGCTGCYKLLQSGCLIPLLY